VFSTLKMVTVILVLCVVSCQFFVFDSGFVSQTQVVLTSQLDEQGLAIDNSSLFDKTIEKIYCVVTLSSKS